MIEKVNSVPPGYHTVTPYLLIQGASDAIAFYVRIFGAEEITRLTAPTAASVTRKFASVNPRL